MTLIEFLLARIAEDEATGQAAMYDEADDLNQPHSLTCGYRATELSVTPACMCGWPSRLLAECDAKRRIIEWHQNWPVLAEREPEFDPPMQGGIRAGLVEQATFRTTKQIAWLTEQEYRTRFGDEPPTGPILKMLALPYADHPDYCKEWRP